MPYFDFHVHPTLKPGLTDDTATYTAWTEFPFFARGIRHILLQSFEEIVTSQANLTQLKKTGTVSVIALIGLEKAFAGNWAIQKILASPRVSPLSRDLLLDVVENRVTYHEMFIKDVNVLLNDSRQQDFTVLKKFEDMSDDKVNLVLSVEGAHSFQSVTDDAGETEIRKSIVDNFKKWKNDSRFRIHHLTLTHLTRQPACVHCFGVKITVLGRIDLTRDLEFQPDPAKAGISPLGFDVIKAAYDSRDSKPVLLDIKHMSYYARTQFYQLRHEQGYQQFPIIASHVGVTGTSLRESSISAIEDSRSGCSLVSWNRKAGLKNTFFNPWTINLFDEDILEIIKSGGLLGISLDQRILGYQKKFFGEFMSPLEVEKLKLSQLQTQRNRGSAVAGGFEPPLKLTTATKTENRIDLELAAILELEPVSRDRKIRDTEEHILGHDMIFDVDEEDGDTMISRSGREASASHIDYLSNNILHIVKIGFQNGFQGIGGAQDVRSVICIGSDLDGIVDSMNFPPGGTDGGIDKRNWVTADEYPLLEKALLHSMEHCVAEDEYLKSLHLDITDLTNKVMYRNGIEFLKKHFT